MSEMEAFVSNRDIVNKMLRIEHSGSKINWCWPVAVLGFLFGPAGAAIWFFRRKMSRIASILLVLGIVFAAINVLFSVFVYNNADVKGLLASSEAFFSGEIGLYEFGEIATDFLHTAAAPWFMVATFLMSVVELAFGIGLPVVCGMYAVYLYKEYAVKRIIAYRATNIDPRYYQLGLSSVGGISGGMMAVGIVCCWLIQVISENITAIFI